MAHYLKVISNEKFTVNGKLVYQDKGLWLAAPPLEAGSETDFTYGVINDLKSRILVVTDEKIQKLQRV